jgi:hypothetical protein
MSRLILMLSSSRMKSSPLVLHTSSRCRGRHSLMGLVWDMYRYMRPYHSGRSLHIAELPLCRSRDWSRSGISRSTRADMLRTTVCTTRPRLLRLLNHWSRTSWYNYDFLLRNGGSLDDFSIPAHNIAIPWHGVHLVDIHCIPTVIRNAGLVQIPANIQVASNVVIHSDIRISHIDNRGSFIKVNGVD